MKLIALLITCLLPGTLFGVQPNPRHGMFGEKRSRVMLFDFRECTGTETRSLPLGVEGTLTDAPLWVTTKDENCAIQFINSTDRVLLTLEGLLDYIVADSVVTFVVKYSMNKPDTRPLGKIINKQENFTTDGWVFTSNTVATGDFAFNGRAAGVTRKVYTNPVPTIAQSGGVEPHIVIFDKVGVDFSVKNVAIFLDGVERTLALDNGIPAPVANDTIVAIGNHSDGTGGGANFRIHWIDIYREGSDQHGDLQLNVGDALRVEAINRGD